MKLCHVGLMFLSGFLVAGCSSVRETQPARTATEQLLLSTAADRAAAQLDLAGVKGKTVAIIDARFEAFDKLYMIAMLEDRLLKLGALVVKDAAKAEWHLELRSGALSIDRNSFLFGIPQIALPIPLAGAIPIPELAFFKRDRQNGIAKLAWTARIAATGELAGSSGPAYGESKVTAWSVMTIGFMTQDVLPEKD